MQAFARLHARHRDARLYLHTARRSPALDLRRLARELDILDAVRWPSQYQYKSGLIGPQQLADTYRALDLYSGCSYAEGFGLPLVEAQACGVPAVATDFSAMPETCGGWLVPGEPHDLERHRSRWLRPSVDAITDVYEEAYRRGPAYQSRRTGARDHAQQFDADQVWAQHWKPALAELEE
jgi:glycosyltransferase involved in cell wall biosynthesis